MSNNNQILVEWTELDGLRRASKLTDMIGDGKEALESAVDTVEDIAEIVATKFKNLMIHPTQRELGEIQVEFGIKLDAEVGAIVAKSSIEGSILVRMTWRTPSE